MSEIKKYLTLIAQNRFDLDSIFSKIPESILSDTLFFKYAIKINGDTMKYAPLEISLNKELVLEAIVNSKKSDLQWINPIFQDDKDIILNVLEKNGYNLKFPINVLGKEYKELLLNALNINFRAINFISNEYWNEIKNNRGLFIEFLSSNSLLLSEAKNEYKNDKEIVLLAIKNGNGRGIINYASEKLRNDKGLVLLAIQNNDDEVFYNTKVKNNFVVDEDEDIILEGIKFLGTRIFKSHVSDDLKNNIKFFLKCFEINNAILYHIDLKSSILTNPNFVLAAIPLIDLKNQKLFMDISNILFKKNNDNTVIVLELLKKINNTVINLQEIFSLLSKKLIENEDFIIELVSIDWRYLKFCSEEIRSNSKIVLSAIKKNGNAVYFAHDTLKIKKEIILEAIKYGAGTKIIPYELATRENVLLAVHESIRMRNESKILGVSFDVHLNIDHIDDSLKNDEDFMLKLINLDGQFIRYASTRILENYEIVSKAFGNTRDFLFFEPKLKRFNNDKNLVLLLLRNSSFISTLSYINYELRDDKDVVLCAVIKDGKCLVYASERLKDDVDIVLASISHKANNNNLEFATDRLKSDQEIVLKALEKNRSAIIHMSNDLINDRNFILKITQKYSLYTWDILKLIESFSKDLKNDKEFILEFIKRTKDVVILKFCSQKIKDDLDIHVAKLNIQYT